MVILNQRENELILLGDDIFITFLGMIGRRAKIGIMAKNLLPILREEISQELLRKKIPVRKKR